MAEFIHKLKLKVAPILEAQMDIFPLSADLGISIFGELNLEKSEFAMTMTLEGEEEILFRGDQNACGKFLSFFENQDVSSLKIDPNKYDLYYTEFKKNEQVLPHTHPVDLIIFLLVGEIVMSCEDRSEVAYSSGSFFYIPHSMPHSFTMGPCGAACIEFWKGKDFWD